MLEVIFTKNEIFKLTEEQRMLREMVAEFTEKEIEPQAAEHHKSGEFNRELFQKLAELGYLGANIDKNYGGAFIDPVSSVIIHEEMAKSDPAFTLSYLAHNVLFAHNLDSNGSHEQKQKYLEKVVSGEWLAGIAMTEDHAGSDFLSQKTTAVRDWDYWILNGTKQFITNFDGDVFLVYAKTGEGRNDFSLFIVESGYEGFSIGKKLDKDGMRASPTGELIFANCKVPLENLVEKENGAIAGMFRNLEMERVTLAAISYGIALRTFQIMKDYAIERKTFGKKIYQHGQIEKFIGESYSEILHGRLGLYHVTSKINPNENNAIWANSVKLYAADLGVEVTSKAMQVLGAWGYMTESKIPRFYSDAPLLKIGGGTDEMMHRGITRDLVRGKKQ